MSEHSGVGKCSLPPNFAYFEIQDEHMNIAAALDLSAIEIPFTQLLMYTGGGLVFPLALMTLYLFATNRRHQDSKSRMWVARLAYALFLITIGILAVTSFTSIVLFEHLFGYALLAHVSAAGAFVFLLLLIAFLYLPRGLDATDQFATGDNRWWLARWSAWLLVVSSIAAAGTMFVSMLPILDTDGLKFYALLHRYAGLLVVVAAIVHFYSLVCTKFGLR